MCGVVCARRQFSRVNILCPPYGSQRTNPGLQVWKHMPLLTEASFQPRLQYLKWSSWECNGLVIKSTGCSFIGRRFVSRHLHGSSQPLNSFPKHFKPSSDLPWHKAPEAKRGYKIPWNRNYSQLRATLLGKRSLGNWTKNVCKKSKCPYLRRHCPSP